MYKYPQTHREAVMILNAAYPEWFWNITLTNLHKAGILEQLYGTYKHGYHELFGGQPENIHLIDNIFGQGEDLETWEILIIEQIKLDVLKDAKE